MSELSALLALVKGLRKAVAEPDTEWVDANIVRLLLDRYDAVDEALAEAASDASACRHTEHQLSGDGLIGRYFDEDFQAFHRAPNGHWEPCPVAEAERQAKWQALMAKRAKPSSNA